MKKTVLFSSLFSLTLPLSAYALGLGEMKVESALDQPFLAEIELIDINSVSISSIRVGLANPDNYQSLGIEQSSAAHSLSFNIKKNKTGKYVVEVHSTERMTEPYMQLVVDLIWSKGQIYKVYTVLLDPPGYQLATTTAQSGITYQRKFKKLHQKSNSLTLNDDEGSINKKKKAAYGPTVSNENVWQIAQRYKTPKAILPQIVLAIVGANPNAFIDGNLNGLKPGVDLKIPSDKQFSEVPSDLATVEVMAHDKAWNEKSSINHVLAPPYTTGQASNSGPVEYSQIPPVPKFPNNTTNTTNQNNNNPANANQKLPGYIMPITTPALENQKKISPEQSRTLKAEISITTAAIDSLRESNGLLKDQLSLLQSQNKKLQTQLDARDKELRLLHNQIQLLMKEKKGIAGQSSSSMNTSNNTNEFWFLWMLLLLAAGGGVALYYYLKKRDKRRRESTVDTSPATVYPSSMHPVFGLKEEPISPAGLQEERAEKPESTSSPTSKDVKNLNQEPKIIHEAGFPVEPELKPETEFTPETKLKPEPELKPEAQLKLEPELKPKSEFQTETELNPLSRLKSEQEIKPETIFIQEPGIQNGPQLKRSSKSDQTKSTPKGIVSQPELKSLPETTSKRELEVTPEPTSKNELELEPQSLHLHEPELGLETVSESEPKFEPKTTPEQDLKFESEINPKHDRDFESEENSEHELKSEPEVNAKPELEFETQEKESRLIQDSTIEEQVEEQNASSAVEEINRISGDETKKNPVQPMRNQPLVSDEEQLLGTLAIKQNDKPSEVKKADTTQEENVLEFESGLHHLLTEKPSSKENQSQEQPIEEEHTLEFTSDLGPALKGENNNLSNLKNTKALDTLIALAKTYMGMEDTESALHSLNEVLEHGTESQKEEAQRLINEIKGKS